MKVKVLGVIPARYASSRFPGKPLYKILDKPMIEWVYTNAKKSQYISKLVVATDDERIYKTVIEFGGISIMTSPLHPSGTDRVAEVAKKYPDYDIVVNIQGDEPLISPKMIDRTIEPLFFNKDIVVSTPVKRMENEKDIKNPNIVKVVKDLGDWAIYFSRYPIPYIRDENGYKYFYKHIGLYVYKRDFLLKFVNMPQTPLEKAEKLEQLRIIEHGYKIFTVETAYDSYGVDTENDVKKVEEILLNEKESQ